MCPFTKRDWERVFLGGVLQKKIKKSEKSGFGEQKKSAFRHLTQ